MYNLSKYNITSRIAGSNEYFIINLLSGNADIIDEETFQSIQNNTSKNNDALIDKGYLIHPEDEQKLFRKKYLDFLDSRKTDEIQIFFVPWYACNFACSYCYQDEYENEKAFLNTAVIDAFFFQIKHQFSNKKNISPYSGANHYYQETFIKV